MEVAIGANYFPERGLGPMPPTDALLYRLYESEYMLFSIPCSHCAGVGSNYTTDGTPTLQSLPSSDGLSRALSTRSSETGTSPSLSPTFFSH